MNVRTSRVGLGALLTAAILGSSWVGARAASLIGTSVSGDLTFSGSPTNYFDPANGYVPAGYLNDSGTVVSIASPAVEFGFEDSQDTDLANFNGFQFTIEDVVAQSLPPSSAGSPFTMVFTDTAFAGLTLSEATDFFPGGLTYSLVGDTITIQWAGGPVGAGEDYTSTFAVASVPEPSTWGALFLGSLGAGFMALRRRRAV